jgi:fructokinase
VILCAGEALFDFISKNPGMGLGRSVLFEKRPGGAPFNVAVGLSRLGDDVAFLTKLADDSFGKALKETMEKEGINTDYVVVEGGYKTTLAFVALDENGRPDFEFYRENAADMNLRFSEVSVDFSKVSFYHFGSISIIQPPSSETFSEIFCRLEGKAITSFDPNVRRNLIKDRNAYLEKLREILKDVDVLKLSDTDMEYIVGEVNLEGFVKMYSRENKATFLTLGEKGSVAYYGGKIIKQKALKFGKTVDTTGCGDAYMAGVIHVINKEGLSLESVKRAAELGSLIAGIVATRYGAASAIPKIEELRKFSDL